MAFGVSTDIGIDLGTASILVYIKGKGVVLKERSVVAYDRNTNEIKAIGEEARMMIGRTPGNIVAIRPLKQGVIADYTITEKMIRYFIQKAIGKRTFRKPRICVCVPSQITEVERKAVEDATFNAGAREVYLVEEPLAAAIGAGIDITKPCGNIVAPRRRRLSAASYPLLAVSAVARLPPLPSRRIHLLLAVRTRSQP